VYRWAAQDGAIRAYMGFSYIKYSRTSFIPFYYTTEVLNLRPYWAYAVVLGGPAALNLGFAHLI
jgi:hypothetical protein